MVQFWTWTPSKEISKDSSSKLNPKFDTTRVKVAMGANSTSLSIPNKIKILGKDSDSGEINTKRILNFGSIKIWTKAQFQVDKMPPMVSVHWWPQEQHNSTLLIWRSGDLEPKRISKIIKSIGKADNFSTIFLI